MANTQDAILTAIQGLTLHRLAQVHADFRRVCEAMMAMLKIMPDIPIGELISQQETMADLAIKLEQLHRELALKTIASPITEEV